MKGSRSSRALRLSPAAFLFLLLSLLAAPSAHARVQLQPCHTSMPPEKQIEIGRKAAAQVYKEMPVLPDSDPVTQYVASLGQKLAAQAPGYRWPYNFHVVNVDDINAFALPGGTIFVNLGAVQAANTEAQLAGVLAHEISHVVLEHSVCNLEKQQRVGIFAGLGQVASGVLLGDSAIGALAQQGIGLTAGLGFLKMSRGAEQQADLEGVGILYDSGYDPRGMPQFFETIEAKYGQGGAQMLSDHPNPGNRTEYINREIATFQPLDHPVANTNDFRAVHKQAANMQPFTAKEVSSGVWKKRAPNTAAGETLNPGAADAPAAGPAISTSTPKQWSIFQGNGFTVEVPSGWQARGDRNSAQIAPETGVAISADGKQANLVYGLIADLYAPQQAASLRENFSALLRQLASDNPGLEPGPIQRIAVGNLTLDTAECTHRTANDGHGEHVWLVATPSGSALRYLAFVAPEPDFQTARPTFEHVLNSLRLQ